MRSALLMLLALFSAGLGVGRTTLDRPWTTRTAPGGPPAGDGRSGAGQPGGPDRSGCLPGCHVTDPDPGEAGHFCVARTGVVRRELAAFGAVPVLAVEVDQDPTLTPARSVVLVPVDPDGLVHCLGDPVPLDPGDVAELVALLAEAHRLATTR